MSAIALDNQSNGEAPIERKHQVVSTTIASVVAVGLRQYLKELGLNGKSIFQAAGLKHETLSERYSRFPLQQLAVALEISARRGNDPLFGLHFGKWYRPPVQNACNYAINSAPDLRSALNILQDHRNLVAAMSTQLSDQGTHTELSWFIELASLSPRHVIDFKAMRTLRHIQQATGPDWKPLRVNLAYAKPENVSGHLRLFGPNVHFDQPENNFWIDSPALATSMPGADPDICNMAQNSIRNPFPYKQVDKGPVERLRRFISERLDKTDITLAAAAKIMGMTPQQLRRTLKKRGTSFQCVLDDTRKAHAVHYLCKTETRFSEIAYLLGFSDQSCLTRATKRWFGVTPKDLRHNAR